MNICIFWSGVRVNDAGNLEKIFNNKREMKYMKSQSIAMSQSEMDCLTRKEDKPRYIILPDNRYLVYWKALIALVLVFVIITSPFEVSFDDTESENLVIIDYFIDFLFLVDLLLNCITAVYDLKKNLVFSQIKILSYYGKRWFLLDFIACLPIQAFFDNTQKYKNLVRFTQFQKVFRILRLARLIRIIKLLKESDQRKYVDLVLKISIEAKRLIWILLFFMVFIHLVTCFWVFTARINSDYPVTWISAFTFSNMDNIDLYIVSEYWTVTTLVTVGYGDIYPVNLSERIYTVLTMVIGIFSYSYSVSSISTLVRTFNLRKSKLGEKLDILYKLSRHNNFSEYFQKKIADALEYEYRNHDKEFDEIIKELPVHLSQQLLNLVFEQRLSLNAFFYNRPEHFRAWVTSRLKYLKIPPCEFIYKENEYATEMYFLTKGSASLMISRGEEYFPFIEFLEHYYFGEIDLLFSLNKSHLYTAYSESGCELLTLSGEDLSDLLESFEEEYIKISMIAKERLQRTKKKFDEASKEIELRYCVLNHPSVPQPVNINLEEIRLGARGNTEMESIFKNHSLFAKMNSEKKTDSEISIIKQSLTESYRNCKEARDLSHDLLFYLNNRPSNTLS